MRPVLLLEINEVPLRVWKKFAGDPRFPSIARMLRESKLIETVVRDEGELSPWCTWPTFHRGLPKKEHGIFHLGQDPATFRGLPIWEEFRARGMNVGVFGSMQSWPPRDPGDGGFFVPDTFSSDARCIPSYLEPVQAFNLLQVRSNARVIADKALRKPPPLGLLFAMLRSGVRVSTLARVAAQLAAEKINPAKRERRVSFQALIFWDIFRAHFDPERPPAFTTFFTNHIASVMHRFWNHIFPEDFPEALRPRERAHARTMDFAMSVLDEILAGALEWRRRNPELLLLVANSMGQKAVVRSSHEGFEFLIRHPLKLLSAACPGLRATQNLAMMPQVSLELASVAEAEEAARKINSITLPSGLKFLKADSRGTSLTIDCHTPPGAELEKGFLLIAGKEVSFADTGLEKVEVAPGTAYHEKEGLLLAHGLAQGQAAPEKIDATEAKALILGWSGLRS